MSTAPAVAEPPKAEAWHTRSAEEALAGVRSAATGLSAAEAAKRLEAEGPNELREGRRVSPLQILLSQFKSLLIWILIAAGVTSGLLGERIDAAAILAIVLLNAAIGFFQEYKAEKSIAALKKRSGHSSSSQSAETSNPCLASTDCDSKGIRPALWPTEARHFVSRSM